VRKTANYVIASVEFLQFGTEESFVMQMESIQHTIVVTVVCIIFAVLAQLVKIAEK
jgi:hypothetical protein